MRRRAPSQSDTSSVFTTASPPSTAISSTTSWAGVASGADAVASPAEIVHHDRRSVLGQHQRVLPTDSPTGAGDDDDPAFTELFHMSSFLSGLMVRSGPSALKFGMSGGGLRGLVPPVEQHLLGCLVDGRATGLGQSLDLAEPAPETFRGTPQRGLRIVIESPGDLHRSEQEVPDLMLAGVESDPRPTRRSRRRRRSRGHPSNRSRCRRRDSGSSTPAAGREARPGCHPWPSLGPSPRA